MTLSELIAAYGDDRVQFQNLDQSLISLDMNKKRTSITFGTEMRATFDGTEKLGLIVWLDRDWVAEITKKPTPPSTEG